MINAQRITQEATRCPFCFENVSDEATCAECNAVIHCACWEEHGQCASCGHPFRVEEQTPDAQEYTPNVEFLQAHVDALRLAEASALRMYEEEQRARLNAEARAHELEGRVRELEAEGGELTSRQNLILETATKLWSAYLQGARALNRSDDPGYWTRKARELVENIAGRSY